jgi:hypothetical protein
MNLGPSVFILLIKNNSGKAKPDPERDLEWVPRIPYGRRVSTKYVHTIRILLLSVVPALINL